jgi:hypothetical protein
VFRTFKYIFILVLATAPICLNAQTDSLNVLLTKHLSGDTSDGQIEVHADPRIDSLEVKSRINKLKGYRIQVFLGSFAQCRDERVKFQKVTSELPTYQVQSTPDYAVRVGDFRNLVDAQIWLEKVKPYYPGAFIISDQIEPPRLK